MTQFLPLEQFPQTEYQPGYTGEVQTYSFAVAQSIGALMPFLDDRHTGTPIDQGLLGRAITSPDHAQVISTASDNSKVVGAHALSVGRTLTGTHIRLGDYVVHPEARGRDPQGRSVALDELRYMTDKYGPEHGATELRFESEVYRGGAHSFYQRNGANIEVGTQHWAIDHLPEEDIDAVLRQGNVNSGDYTGPVDTFSPDVMHELARLYPDLELNATSIRAAIETPGYDLLVARRAGHLVGAAMVSTSIGPFEHVTTRPNGMRVSEAAQQDGVQLDLWKSIVGFAKKQCTQGGINFEIPEGSTEVSENDAVFYAQQGVELDTDNAHFVLPLGAAAA